MRHTFMIAAWLTFATQSLASAQNSADDARNLQAARSELDALKAEVQSLKESCGAETTNRSGTVSRTTRQMILRRYRWVPASSASNQQLLSSGLTALGAGDFSALAVTSQSQMLVQPSPFVAPLSSPVITSNFGTAGFTSGLPGTLNSPAGLQAFSPAPSNVLPASPYSAHSSYGIYSDGPVSQSLSAGVTSTRVYPTATFRGTGGFINNVPAPHYSAY